MVTRMILVDNKKDDDTIPKIKKRRNFVHIFHKKIWKKTASSVQI
jgi:hypothetical protein